MKMGATETAVCIGWDAMRLALGIKPKNFTKAQVIKWINLMDKANDNSR